MAATPIALSTKDNAEGILASGINASALTIPLETGDGAALPQPYTGSATSVGSSTALNSTGISAAVGGSAVLGKWIWNKTDGSVAVITNVATDAITTTRLLGGSDNTWQDTDVWAIDPFVATFAILNDDGEITTSEQALITARSTDTLTVPTGGRGYNGTIANSFDAGDSVYLLVTSPIVERVKDIMSAMGVQVNTNITNIATNVSDIDNIESNATFYVAAGGSSSAYTGTLAAMPAAYTTGEHLFFKANHTNTGATTFNRAGLGAKTIKKLDGATDLVAGDIVSGMIVEIVYDGTNYIMLSPIGQVSAADTSVLNSNTADSNSVASTTSETNFSANCSIGSGEWAAGVVLRVKALVRMTVTNAQTATIKIKFGTTALTGATKIYTNGAGSVTSTAVIIEHDIVCVGTPSATGPVSNYGVWHHTNADFGATPTTVLANVTTGNSTDCTTQTQAFDMTGSLTLQLSIQFSNNNANDTARLQRLIVERLYPN